MRKLATFAIAATILAKPAQAVVLQYTISGTDTLSSGQIEYASFRIDTDRPIDGYAEGLGFYYAAVPGTYTCGGTTTIVPQDISFYLDAAHGYDVRTAIRAACSLAKAICWDTVDRNCSKDQSRARGC